MQPVPLKGPAYTALSVFLADCLCTFTRIGNILEYCIDTPFPMFKPAAMHERLFHIFMRYCKRLLWFLVGIFLWQFHVPVLGNQKGSLFIASFLCIRTS